MYSHSILIGSDHAGFTLKQALIPYLRSLGYAVEDCGAFAETPGDDYPDFVTPCAAKVAAESGSFGIVIGKSGQGEAMCANRIKGARAAVFVGGADDIITLARADNDANILALGAQFVSFDAAKHAVELFLSSPFSNDPRHARRLAKF